MRIEGLYSDGGVVGVNPSSIGGTWAFVSVGQIQGGPPHSKLKECSGLLLPGDLNPPTITNNFTELYALVMALEQVKLSLSLSPDISWSGKFYTDSWVTLCRVTRTKSKWKGIPDWLRERVHSLQKHFDWKWEGVLLDGHPTPSQLASGLGKRGNPCSAWNAYCDDLCNRQKRHFPLQETLGR